MGASEHGMKVLFPAAITPDKHIVGIRVFRQVEENHFLPQFQTPELYHLMQDFSEEYRMYLEFPPNNYSAVICKKLRHK